MKTILALSLLSVLSLSTVSLALADEGRFECRLEDAHEDTPKPLAILEVVEGSSGSMSATLKEPKSSIYTVNVDYLKATDTAPAKLKLEFSSLTSKSIEKNYHIFASTFNVGASAEFFDIDLDLDLKVSCQKK